MAKGNVIILNKPFLGGWLDKTGNIGHEVIDFFKADDGQYYVYNNPWGACPDDIWVEGSKNQKLKGKNKYVAKYLVLTGPARDQAFDIHYVIELEEKLHDEHSIKRKKGKNTTEDDEEGEIDLTDWEGFRVRQENVKKMMRNRDIKYNNKYLYEIYGDDESLYLTFKAKRIYKATKQLHIKLEYNFQRNKGYVYDTKKFKRKGEDVTYQKDYEALKNLIDNSIENHYLEEIKDLKLLKDQKIGQTEERKTFMDLIGFADNEQAYTNILHSILEQGDWLKRFCVRFKDNPSFASNEIDKSEQMLDRHGEFKVSRETKIVNGRMDVCAESDKQRVVIENKVYSGLNGIRPADNETQLSTYYKWGTEKSMLPLCFVTLPNSRKNEVKWEIEEFDKNSGKNMAKVYRCVTYSEIANFIKDNANDIPQDYVYSALISQIIDAFNNLGEDNKEALYARMFLAATNK